MQKQFQSAYGVYSLERLPKGDKTLQAWDAADELLISYVAENVTLSNIEHIAIVNDSFGAISCVLQGLKRDNISDSLVSHLATAKNFKDNSLSPEDSGLYQAVTSCASHSHHYDLVLVKIPKSLALLEDQLVNLKKVISSSSLIIAAGMTRSVHNSTTDLFEQIIGSTTTSLAKKKARLIFAKNNAQCFTEDNIHDYQDNKRISTYKLEGTNLNLYNYPGVFSRAKLDIGTRFFLPEIKNYADSTLNILDLGCGNGALGMKAAFVNPKAKITFVDESYQAIESVKMAFSHWSGENKERYTFRVSDILQDITEEDYDLILCNPPFHQNNSIGKHTAFLMFQQARRVLKKNGKLQVVANRHLQYQHKLKKLFGNCRLLNSNSKFVILESEK